MKSSGVDALAEIPAHWLVVPTRHLCVITTGSEDSGNATDDGEYPFYVRGRETLRIGHFSFDCEAVMTPGDGQGGTGKVFHYAKGRFEAHQPGLRFQELQEHQRVVLLLLPVDVSSPRRLGARPSKLPSPSRARSVTRSSAPCARWSAAAAGPHSASSRESTDDLRVGRERPNAMPCSTWSQRLDRA